MFAQGHQQDTARSASVQPLGLWLVLAVLIGTGLAPQEAEAQRPFRLSDPFYRNETARRDFFDNYALTAEVFYQSGGTVQDEGGLAASDNDVSFRFRFDYELAASLDLSGIFEAIPGNGGRQLSMSWVVLKYYRYLESSDYAFRLAVDPSLDAGVGFPQVDLAFLYTTLYSPLLSSDFAMGVRRVNISYGQFLPAEPLPPDGPFVARPRPSLLVTQAFGTELHAMINYNLHFDPAGSNFYVGLLGEGGAYDVGEKILDSSTDGLRAVADLGINDTDGEAGNEKTAYRGGAVWARGGIEFKRPNYQIAPYISLPLQQWNPEREGTDDWPVARLHFGLQFMLR